MIALLVYPEFPDTFWSFKHALRFIRKRSFLPPLGLLTVAALLPSDWRVKLVDLNIEKLRQADLEEADLVLIGGMIAQRTSAREVIRRCRAAGKTVVAGGPLFTAEHRAFPEVDHFVLDEAEITLPLFLEDWRRGSARRMYRVFDAPGAGLYPDLSRTPAPRWELAKLGSYASMAVQFSRGCPYDCEFCNVTALFGRKPRTKAPSAVIAELNLLFGLGWRGAVFFVDDNLIGSRRYLKEELLPALIDWRRRHPVFTFNTQASINLVDDPELMDMLVQAGFCTVFIGIETPDDTALTECNKKQNRGRDMVDDVRRIQRAGLQVQGGFIVGFDGDTPDVFERQIDFIQKSGTVTAMVGLLNALPDTKLHARLKREGRLLGETTGNNVDGTMNFVPRMDRDELHAGYRRLVRHLYAPSPYYRRLKTFLRNYHPPRPRISLSWRNVRAFTHSSIHLGVLGRERFHYWHLLAWTLVRRPRLLETAVTLAVYGYHFRKCCGGI